MRFACNTLYDSNATLPLVARSAPIRCRTRFLATNNQPANAVAQSISTDMTPVLSDFAHATKALHEAHRDLLELTARGAPVGEALNAAVRAVAKVRRTETRAAIFIFDPEGVKLRFAAADGPDEGYTSKIDNFPVGPGQPSCGRAPPPAFLPQQSSLKRL